MKRLFFMLAFFTSHLVASSGPVVVEWVPSEHDPLYDQVAGTWTDYVVSSEYQRMAIITFLHKIGTEHESLAPLCREILGRISANGSCTSMIEDIYNMWAHIEKDDGLPSGFDEKEPSKTTTVFSHATSLVAYCVQRVRGQ